MHVLSITFVELGECILTRNEMSNTDIDQALDSQDSFTVV